MSASPQCRRRGRRGRRGRRSDATSKNKLDNALRPFLPRALVRAERIRQWGRENGSTVNDKGQLPKDLIATYDEANGWPSADLDPAAE